MIALTDTTNQDPAHGNYVVRDFIPGPNDVVIGRGLKIFQHQGNQRMRQLVQARMSAYSQAATKVEKSMILGNVIAEVRSNQGSFVKKANDGSWYDVGNLLARERVSQAFRDALHQYYRSSSTAKTTKRRIKRQTAASKVAGPNSWMHGMKPLAPLARKVSISSVRENPTASQPCQYQLNTTIIRAVSPVTAVMSVQGHDLSPQQHFEGRFAPEADALSHTTQQLLDKGDLSLVSAAIEMSFQPTSSLDFGGAAFSFEDTCYFNAGAGQQSVVDLTPSQQPLRVESSSTSRETLSVTWESLQSGN